MTGGPRPNPYGVFPISRPFGGGQMTGMSAPAVQPPDPNQSDIFRADAGEPMINTAQSGGGGVF